MDSICAQNLWCKLFETQPDRKSEAKNMPQRRRARARTRTTVQAARSRGHIPPAPTNRRWAWLQPTLGAEAWAYRGLHTPCYRPWWPTPWPHRETPNQVYSSPAILYSRLDEYKMRPWNGLYILSLTHNDESIRPARFTRVWTQVLHLRGGGIGIISQV